MDLRSVLAIVCAIAVIAGILLGGAYYYWRRKRSNPDETPPSAPAGKSRRLDDMQRDEPAAAQQQHACSEVMRRMDSVFGKSNEKALRAEVEANTRRINGGETSLADLRRRTEALEHTVAGLGTRCDKSAEKLTDIDRGLGDAEFLAKQVREEMTASLETSKQLRSDTDSLSRRVYELNSEQTAMDKRLGQTEKRVASVDQAMTRLDSLETKASEIGGTVSRVREENAALRDLIDDTVRADIELLGSRVGELEATTKRTLSKHDLRAAELCLLHESTMKREAARMAQVAVKNGNGLVTVAMTQPLALDDFITNLGVISPTWRSVKHFNKSLTTYVMLHLTRAMSLHDHELARQICAVAVDSWLQDYKGSAAILCMYQLVPGTRLETRKLAARYLRSHVTKRNMDSALARQSRDFADNALDAARDTLVALFTVSQYDPEGASRTLRDSVWLRSILALSRSGSSAEQQPPGGLMLDQTTFIGALGTLDPERLARVARHDVFAMARKFLEWLSRDVAAVAAINGSPSEPVESTVVVARPELASERLGLAIRHPDLGLSESRALQILPAVEWFETPPSESGIETVRSNDKSPLGVRVIATYAYARCFAKGVAVTVRMLNSAWPVHGVPEPIKHPFETPPPAPSVPILDVQRIVQSRMPQWATDSAAGKQLGLDDRFGIVESASHGSTFVVATLRAKRAESFVMAHRDTVYAYQDYEVSEFGAYRVRELVILSSSSYECRILVTNLGDSALTYRARTMDGGQEIAAGKTYYFSTKMPLTAAPTKVADVFMDGSGTSNGNLDFPLQTLTAARIVRLDNEGWLLVDGSEPRIWVPLDARRMCNERVFSVTYEGAKRDFELDTAENQWLLKPNDVTNSKVNDAPSADAATVLPAVLPIASAPSDVTNKSTPIESAAGKSDDTTTAPVTAESNAQLAAPAAADAAKPTVPPAVPIVSAPSDVTNKSASIESAVGKSDDTTTAPATKPAAESNAQPAAAVAKPAAETAAKPTAEESTTAAVAKPTAEESTTAAVAKPSAETAAKPAVTKPVEESTAAKPTAETAVTKPAEEPAAAKPAVTKPVEESTAAKPTAETAVTKPAEEPAAAKPAVTKPVEESTAATAAKPTAETAVKPAVTKPVEESTAATATKPTVETAVTKPAEEPAAATAAKPTAETAATAAKPAAAETTTKPAVDVASPTAKPIAEPVKPATGKSRRR